MADASRSCWCGADSLRAFGPDYLRCTACETLVGQAGLTDKETLVRDDEVDFYGKRYWLEFQPEAWGYPDVYVRARQDLSERCVHWLKTLLRYRQPPAKVLEIGAGPGTYTALLRWAGYEATALDLSTWVAEFAKARFGIPYLVGSVESQNLRRRSFDVVVGNDVLEHLPEPEATMRRCVELLKPDGVLVIQTPEFQCGRRYEELVADGDLFLEHMRKAREHLYLFSRKALELLLGRLGVGEIAFEEPAYSYDMQCVASAAPLQPTDGDPSGLATAAPAGPLVLALIDAHAALKESEADRQARLAVIEQLDAALKGERSLPKRGWRWLRGVTRPSEIPHDDLRQPVASSAGVKPRTRTAQRQALDDAHPTSNPPHGGSDRWPRISVVTPAYNSAEFLEDCIVSILEQGYQNLEYIVIDGASTDGSTEILRRYEDRLAYWTSEPDDGQADALNKGFRRATGELVCWLNSDDFYYPGALAAAAEAYLAHLVAPFYFGNGYRVDRVGRKVAEFFPDGRVHFQRDALVFGLNCVLQPSTFIRRSALEQVGLLDDSLHYGFDSDLWIRLSALGPPQPIRKHLAASREYRETKTATGSFERAEELRQIAERHASVAATPGSIRYYLETLHRLAAARPDVFPREYLAAIESFQSSTAQLLGRYGARPDGFPVPGAAGLLQPVPLAPPKAGRTRVGIELRGVTRGASGGIAVVVVGTLRELFERRTDVDFVVFCTVFNRELLAVDAPNVQTITLPLHGFFDELSRIAREWEVDVLIRSYPTVEEVDFPLKRQIFLLPDVQHEYWPEFFDPQSLDLRRRAFRIPLQWAGAIMTISEHARETIEQHAAPGRDVFVASPSLPPEFVAARSEDVADEERALLPDGDFFFFPANLWPHKNHDRLFEALRLFRARTGNDVELVLTGSPAGWEKLRARYDQLPIRHLGYVGPALVRLLYERALALTFFSRYEGLGIPLLEAFEVGTPVVCSNTTSLPEVAGDAALMCDPTDVGAISELLERIAGDAGLRAELIARGKRRLGLYTWAEAADQLTAGIGRVIKHAQSRPLGDWPVVSIVTPSYNQGRFLRRTIESVLAQTYPNIEYIVVDGASTDETLDILRSYGDRVPWISEPDSGQTEAINKGLRAMSGQIVGYLNSDDILLPDAIVRVVDYFRDHPECDLVYGDADYIDEEDNVIGTYATAEYSFDGLMEDCCICQPAAYWRAAVGETVGAFDEELHYPMDLDYWIRVDRSGFVIEHMRETIAQSRLHPEAKTLSAQRAFYREIFDVCRSRGGYISRTYVGGLWHHFVYERPHTPLRLLRSVPVLRQVIVSVHWRWLNRHLYTRKQLLTGSVRAARRLIIRHLRRMPRLFAELVRVKAWLRTLWKRIAWPARAALRVAGLGAKGRPRVSGYWPDNWIEARLDVVVDARETNHELRLVGRPIAEMTVEVAANGTRLGSFKLAGGREETVPVQLPPGPRKSVSLSFSDYVVDVTGRPISFLLQETNLFREEDLAAHRRPARRLRRWR